MRVKLERLVWYPIWLYSIFFHLVATPLMYQIWWRFAYKRGWPYMEKSKREGRAFAQPYGEGIEGVFTYLRKP
jgi:hypothetical protein